MLEKLSEWAKANGVHEAHARALAREGLLPVVRIGRRLFVHRETIDEWARAGGAALPGGWRRTPAEKPAA
jgi:excisionase family DNA binding protein